MNVKKEIEQLIDRAIFEDVGSGDITTLACIPEQRQTTGTMILKQSGVVAGLPLLDLLFKKLNPKIETTLLVSEGSFQKAGEPIAKVTGPAQAILTGERVALNLLQHAAGVASMTAAYVKKVAGLKCDILDTRKTLPGLRALEKYAVAMGGGKNHRNGLDDCFLIKPSHLKFLAGSDPLPIGQAVNLIKKTSSSMPLEIQIESLSYLEEALKYDFRAIMLRNLTIDELRQCVQKTKKGNKKVYLAFSGNVSLETVRLYAETGINGISVAALTHSVPGLDITMRLK